MRALHALSRLGVDNAEFRVLDDAPEFIRSEFFQPGKVYEGVKVRLATLPAFLPV